MEHQLKHSFSGTYHSSSVPSVDEEDDDYFGSFPPGYRFRPLDEELVVYYLIKKIYNQQLPPNRIKEVQLYKYDPDTLAANYEWNGAENEWYFFTPRERKYPNGERPDRAAGDGYWKATGRAKSINFNKKKVGSKTSLVYYRGEQQKGKKTEWIMHEYTALNAPKRRKISQGDMKLDDWVLCKIRKNERFGKASKHVSSCAVEPIEFHQQSENVSSVPIMSVEPIEFHQQSENVSSVPIMSGVNNSHGDNNFAYSRISESIKLPYHDSFAYAQPITMFPVNVPLIDDDELIPYHDTMQAAFDHLINDPIQCIDFEIRELGSPKEDKIDEFQE